MDSEGLDPVVMATKQFFTMESERTFVGVLLPVEGTASESGLGTERKGQGV